jgi:3-oxoacyl-[acyl-carrier-protein] synthase I
MITILGGELLCALGRGEARIAALRDGKPVVTQQCVDVAGETACYPYYRIDDTSRISDSTIVDGYLRRVTDALLAKLGLDPADLTKIGVFLGSSTIDYSLAWPIEENVMGEAVSNWTTERVGGGRYADTLMDHYGFDGPSLTYNTACTSSANALMDAAAMLEGGVIDYALVLGLELFSRTTIEGFMMMQLISPDAIRPFDAGRSGVVLGEAVSAVMLSRDDVADAPWRYLGGRSNCETHSVTGANPNGEGIAEVMREALDDAGTTPEEIVAIKAHGTASDLNDEAEMRGMERLFETLPPYLSLKPYVGHTLGGCGTAELLLMMESIDHGFIPRSVNFDTLDPSFTVAPIRETMPAGAGRYLLNYFGFGGNNTSFVIEKEGV